MSLHSFFISLPNAPLTEIIQASSMLRHKDRRDILTAPEKNALFQLLFRLNQYTQSSGTSASPEVILALVKRSKILNATPCDNLQHPASRLKFKTTTSASALLHFAAPAKLRHSTPQPRPLRDKKLKTKPKAVLLIQDPMSGERFVHMTKLEPSVVTQTLTALGLSANLKDTLQVDDQVLLALTLRHPYATPQTHTIVHDYSAYPAQPRPPIITIMGHVDHGKTSILDYIRKTHLTAKEFGRITQKIGAYTAVYAGQVLTFLDTPGHKAFAAIRARGSAVADIVVLVIDVTSGIQPQTLEAIQYIQAKRIPTVIALNKIDQEHPPLKHLYDALASQNLLIEAYGGDIPAVQTSTVQGTGMDDLLQSLLALAEVLELRAAFAGPAEGYTLESRLDQRMGIRTTVVVTNGQLKIGDMMLVGEGYGVVKALRDEFDRPIRQAGPALPIDVIGLQTTAQLGTKFAIAPDMKTAKAAVALFTQKPMPSALASVQPPDIQQLLQAVAPPQDLPLILKADSQGSLAALQQEIQSFITETRQIKIKRAGIGSVSPDDLEFAAVTAAVIIYFNVTAPIGVINTTLPTAKGLPITVIQSNIVYRLMEEIEHIFVVREKQQVKEVLGAAEVVAVFQGIEQKIAGCKVVVGKLIVNTTVHVIRDGKVLLIGKIQSLRHLKDDIKEARTGTECGTIIKGYQPLVGDKIEFYK